MAEKNLSIEENLEKIEEITKKLSSGELSLEESLKEFENGVSLIREAEAYLSDVEKRLEVLKGEGNDGTI